MKEIWLPILKTEGKYEVSNHGRVRSVSRKGFTRPGVIAKWNGRILSGGNCSGYRIVALGKQFMNQKVHRLVAEAFIPNPLKKETVNHKNGIKDDNRVENLEWATIQENTRHGRRLLGRCIREKNGRAKLTEDDVCLVRLMTFYGASQSAIARFYNVTPPTIRNIVKGKTWR